MTLPVAIVEHPVQSLSSSCRAVILVGHGSLRAGSGAAMIRLAARAQEAGVAPIVAAGFINYSRPRFAETLARVIAKGASEIVVQPYFLVPGKFVSEDVERLVQRARVAHPLRHFHVAEPFNDHPALAELVLKRAQVEEGCGETGNGKREAGNGKREAGSGNTSLLLIAHGSPDPTANAPIQRVAAHIRERQCYGDVTVSFLGLNEPLAPHAIDTLVARGFERIVIVPYFLQFGGHTAEDVPLLIDQARTRHSSTTILRAEHLGYDPLLVDVIAGRVAEAVTR